MAIRLSLGLLICVTGGKFVADALVMTEGSHSAADSGRYHLGDWKRESNELVVPFLFSGFGLARSVDPSGVCDRFSILPPILGDIQSHPESLSFPILLWSVWLCEPRLYRVVQKSVWCPSISAYGEE
jgi:hypothetical protein